MSATHPGAAPTVKPRRLRTAIIIWAAVLAAADLAIKALAESLLSAGEKIDLGLLNIKLLYNPGIAFSLGADLPSWVIIASTGLIIAGLAWFILSSATGMSALSRTGAAMLLGGAGGNFLDRLDGKGVVDYLHTGWFPTFNLADVFVTTGAVLLAIGAFLPSNAGVNAKNAQPAA